MDSTRSLYDQHPLMFWASSMAATVWILNIGLDLFQDSVNPIAGLMIPVGLFYICWTIIWYYLRDQRNPLCFLGNLCLLGAMAGYAMFGLGLHIAHSDFLSRYVVLPLIGPCLGVVGIGLLVMGKEVNTKLHQTSPICRRRDSTIC